MKHLNLIIGLSVAAVLATGVYYAKTAHETMGEAPPPTVPDVTREDGAFVVDGVTVQVQVAARPITAYEETTWRFRFTGADDALLVLEQGVVKFNMSMDMGRHHYALEPDGDAGWYAANAPIPMCPSGKFRWYGNMEFTIAGAAHRGGFQFDIAP